jgi:osmotically-inducible protein OsmY
LPKKEGETMMKKDTDLQSDVNAELAWDPSVQAENIGVAVREGIVTLNGSVFTYSEKFAAEAAVRRVAGVRGIAEEMTVNLLGTHQRNDSDIAEAIRNGLDWNTRVPKGVVTCLVEGGAVVLGGTVDWNVQRDAAYKTVRHLLGVRSVSNQIVVRSKAVNAADIQEKIVEALKRVFIKDAAGITVKTNAGVVSLHGKVHSWEEHDQAARAAWSAPGVTAVENGLAVVY